VKRLIIRLLVLLWLGWYVSGPAFEAIDSWDSPQEEISDVVRSAGGLVTLIGAAIGFAISLFRRLRDVWIAAARAVRESARPFIAQAPSFPVVAMPILAHSPPTNLRI
jgi:hypothetical protein